MLSMADPVFGLLLPVGFAIFVWWFSTGLVLLLDGLPHTTFRWSHFVSSLLALAAFAGLHHTASQATVTGAFCAFTCALLVWGWHELSFLTGWITGPRQRAVETGAKGWPRFLQATQAILWHELAILASGVAIAVLTWREPNQVGMATFAVLWVMRISAKLNVFLGVRNLSAELLPAHLVYLASYFRRRRMNALFPLSVIAATAVATLLIVDALAGAPGSARSVGGLLVSTLLALAILEHWLLVLPFKANALWGWALRARGDTAPPLPARLETDDQLLHAR
jgi:putative photosynthetic complex assembly protein 2